MAFWLARERRAQESTFMQRFDPRFWAINFPRPAMAAVVTTGPDSLRVDVELHLAGELVGLIWEAPTRSITLCSPTRPTAITPTRRCGSAGNPMAWSPSINPMGRP